MQGETGQEFEKRLFDLIDFLLPGYVKEGKNQIVISMGCTGGKHRSVTFAERTGRHISENRGYIVKTFHRDIDR